MRAPNSPNSGPVVLGVRHGEVENHTGGYYGHLPGFGLSSVGRNEAQAVGRALSSYSVSAIYSSPLERAKETADLIGASVGAPVAVDERLIEWRFWEAMQGRASSDALRSEIREIRRGLVANPDDMAWGESLNQFRARLRSWFEGARSSHPSGLVIGIAHFDTLRILLMDLLGWNADRFWDISVGNCQVVRLHPAPLPDPYDVEAIIDILERENVP